MGNTILGFDIGVNSIGWALIDDGKQSIIDMGVRIFPEGVDRDQTGKEKSKNEERRTKRGVRRQVMRRSRRKHKLIKTLHQMQWLPTASTDDWNALLNKDPYELRYQALHQQLSLHELGRVLVHINQRRGFQSNRKTDKSEEKEKSKMKLAMQELAQEMKEHDHPTLGVHFAQLRNDEKQKIEVRVRGRHTLRKMYEDEFEKVWQHQQKYYPNELTDERKQEIKDIIFFQRNVYWKTSTIGKCELEKGEKRCPRADVAAQQFRIWLDLNNLRYVMVGVRNEQEFTKEEKFLLFEKLNEKKELSFVDMRKLLKLPEDTKFNYEKGKRIKIQGNETAAALSSSKIFGKDWHDFDKEKQSEIVNQLISPDKDDDKIIEVAKTEWGLSEEQAINLLNAKLPEKYMNFSRTAILKMLPYVIDGLPLMSHDNTPSAMSEAGYLRPDQRPKEVFNFLPAPPDLPNPIVRQIMFEFRKLMNAIIREYGKPDEIHIELAREAKMPKNKREEMLTENREREKQRKEMKDKIEKEYGVKATREAILRYSLWLQQKGQCVYSGKAISPSQLFSGSGELDIDHILPKSRSLDDSQSNKVLCYRHANADKGNRTPREWLEHNPERFEQVMQWAKVLPINKWRKFYLKEIDTDSFVARQLNDTAYVSREIHKYVQLLGLPPQNILCIKGQTTSELRHLWGLNSVLHPEQKDIKNRKDHRHHAVDAAVIASTSRSTLQRLSKAQRHADGHFEMEPPWEDFRAEIERRINQIYVSHRVRRKLSGALHEETIYGPTETPNQFVYRKPLDSLTPKMVKNIRDEAIRKLVIERLNLQGIDVESKTKISKEVWKEPLTMPSGVVIKKVRVLTKDKTIQPIRNGTAHVTPGNTHHICLFEWVDEKGKTVRDAVFVSMLEAMQRIKNNVPLIQRVHSKNPDAKFLTSIASNELFLIPNEEGKDILYRFETASSTSQYIKFRHHIFSGKSSETIGRYFCNPNTFNGRKVTVDCLGRIRNAND